MLILNTATTLLYLGLYADEKEAAIQYDNAAKKYFGEYARINFPQL